MGIKYLSYLDIPLGRRITKGSAALNSLQRALGQPGIADDQRQEIEAKIAKVTGWIDGTLDVANPGVPHYEPVGGTRSTPPEPIEMPVEKKIDRTPVIEVGPEEELSDEPR